MYSHGTKWLQNSSTIIFTWCFAQFIGCFIWITWLSAISYFLLTAAVYTESFCIKRSTEWLQSNTEVKLIDTGLLPIQDTLMDSVVVSGTQLPTIPQTSETPDKKDCS